MTMMVICLSVGMHVGCLTMRVLLLGDDFLFLDLMRLHVVIEFDLIHLYIANGTLSLPRVLHLHMILDENF